MSIITQSEKIENIYKSATGMLKQRDSEDQNYYYYYCQVPPYKNTVLPMWHTPN